MEIREQQQAASAGLGFSIAAVALLPATAALDLKWVGLAVAAALLCMFKAVPLLSAGESSTLLRRKRGFEWLLALLLAVFAGTTLASPWPDAGWLDLEQLLPALVVAVVAHNLKPDPKGRLWVMGMLLGGALLVSLYALLQTLGIEFVAAYEAAAQRGRAMAGFGNPTFLAGWLVAVWPFCFMAWFRGWRLAAGLIALMVLAALLLTQTRSGVLALILQLALAVVGMLAVQMSRKQRARRLLQLWGMVTVVILAAVLVFPMQSWLRPTQRLELWSASLHLWQQRPWVGFGPGSFVLAMQNNLPAALAQSLEASRQFAEHPHNFILMWLCEGGLLYAAVFTALIVYALRGPWSVLALGRRQRREFHEGEVWILVLGLSLAGLLAQNFFDRNLKLAGSSIFFFSLLGWMTPPGEALTTRVIDVGTRRVTGALLMLAAFLFAFTAIKPVGDYRELKAKGGFVGQKVEESSAQEKSIGKFLFENPDNPEAWEQYAESLARQEKFSQAVQAYKQALRLNPKSIVSMMNLGNCYFHLNQWDKAMEQFKAVIALKPKHADAYFNLAYVYYYKNKMTLAVKYLNKTLRYDAGHAGARKLKKVILSQ